jgi:hypothetical protein
LCFAWSPVKWSPKLFPEVPTVTRTLSVKLPRSWR